MAIENINVGSSPNDGNGDPIRDAFIKCNDNFDELETTKISGSGTDDYIPKFNGSDAIENSQIFDNGTNVGIGTNTPGSTLQVGNGIGIKNIFISGAGNNLALGGLSVSFLGFSSGTISTINTSGSVPLGVGTRSTQPLVLGTNNAERMRIDSSGNVGIGTSSPSDKLEVQNGASGAKIKVSNSGGGSASLEISSNASSVAQLNFTNQLSLIGGNVGIGTTSPATFLQIKTATNQNVGYFAGINGSTISSFNDAVSANVELAFDASTHKFNISGFERMRITSSGDVCIGKTVTDYTVVGTQIEINGKALGITRDIAGENIFLNRTSSQTGSFISFYYNNGGVGSITTNGSITSYNITSDYRLKEDFKSINGLDLISKIKIYDFKFKNSDFRMGGVIAHELQEVVPYAVNGEKDAEEMQSVDYSKLVPILVQAIQELKAEIEILKTK
jgi:hypothetical protein